MVMEGYLRWKGALSPEQAELIVKEKRWHLIRRAYAEAVLTSRVPTTALILFLNFRDSSGDGLFSCTGTPGDSPKADWRGLGGIDRKD